MSQRLPLVHVPQLQVDGPTELDGGLTVYGPAQLNNIDLVALVRKVPQVIQRIVTGSTPGFGVGVSPSFQNIPQNFTDLELTYTARDTSNGVGLVSLLMTMNTGASYYCARLQSNGAASATFEQVNQASGICGLVTQGAAPLSNFFRSHGTITIYDYTDANQVQAWTYSSQGTINSISGSIYQESGGGFTGFLGPITRIDLLLAPIAGCTFTLRGK